VKQQTYYPEEHSGICVVKRPDESVEDLIKRFRKKFSKSGLVKELKERAYYEKPSVKKRRKRMQSIRLIEREQSKMDKMRKKQFKNKFDKKGDELE